MQKCNKRQIAITSNETCYNCLKWDGCEEPNKRPYPYTTAERWQILGMFSFVGLIVIGIIYLFLDIAGII